MKVYLAGLSGARRLFEDGILNPSEVNCLESYYSISKWECAFIPQFKNFLLDSGAFTFLNSSKKVDWNDYADRFADFIKMHNIKHYFELDIDSIVGLRNVEILRKRIENRCGIQSIPVWHKNRGRRYFEDMCKEYPYVAIGGIVTKEIPRSSYEKAFPWFIEEAMRHNCNIHGLGYTDTQNLMKYHFSSVDSTTWGELQIFNGRKIIRHSSLSNGQKHRNLISVEQARLKNLKEWIKFSKYAEINL